MWASSRVLNACFGLPSTTANNLDEPVLVLVAVRPTDDSDASCRQLGCVTTRAHPPSVVTPLRRPALSMNNFITGSQDCIACGVPGHPKIGRDPGDYPVDHD